MEVGLHGPCGQTVAQILVGLDITEEIECVIIQLLGGEARHASDRLSKRINVQFHAQVIRIRLILIRIFNMTNNNSRFSISDILFLIFLEFCFLKR